MIQAVLIDLLLLAWIFGAGAFHFLVVTAMNRRHVEVGLPSLWSDWWTYVMFLIALMVWPVLLLFQDIRDDVTSELHK